MATPYQLAIAVLEQPQMLAQLAAAQGIEPPETPEEAQKRLTDPSLSPEERTRLRELAYPGLTMPTPESTGGPDVGSAIIGYFKNRLNLGEAPASPWPPFDASATYVPPAAPQMPQAAAPAQAPVAPAPLAQTLMAPPEPEPTPAPAPARTPTLTPMPPPTPVAPVPMTPAGQAAQAAPAAPVPQPTAVPPAAAAPDDPWTQVAKALAGVAAPSTGGATGAARAPGAPAPFTGGALQPQTLALLQFLQQNQQRPRSLGEILAGR